MSRVSVIIPAAGEGLRFREGATGRKLPKLYSQLEGEPLIVRVLRVFDSLPSVREIIIAVRPGDHGRFRREVLSRLTIRKPTILVRGGRTRAESVWNGLRRVSKKSIFVCVHDAARPLVQSEWIHQLMRNLNGWDGVVLGRSVVPTVKVIRPNTGEVKQTLDRSELFEAQTPQLFKKEVLLKSYKTLGPLAFQATDDASLVEATGGRVKAITHSGFNIKVTTYEDLVLARRVVQGGPALRFGLGFDRHRLVVGRPFYLGGVKISSSFGPLGHSDGDLLLHAITDGILGAMGAGDIGDFFSDRNPRWKNVRSERFLRKALDLASAKGMQPTQVDATVILERPKLGSKKKKIQSHVARLLSLSLNEVSIKAKTSEGLGPEGEGKAVSCQALVALSSID